MADFVRCEDNFSITIPEWHTRNNCTYYILNIKVGNVFWTVERRYNDFFKLHEYLESNYSFTTGKLPPKTAIFNKRTDFIEKRKSALQEYILVIVRHLQKTIPKPLAEFLDFHKYDILFIVKELAVHFYVNGGTILLKDRNYNFTPLQIYAIGERMKLPCTNLDLVDQREDFSHVLDFCSQLLELTVVGCDSPILGSNILPNNLPLQFTVFKSLQCLTLNNVDSMQITDLGTLRRTLIKLTLKNCKLSMNLSSFFLCDQTHKTNFDVSNHWVSLTELTITEIPMKTLDKSTKLLSNLRSLNIVDNVLSDFENIDNLQNLMHLNLSHNKMLCNAVQLKLTNLISINVSQNMFSSLKPFSAMLALETLNLQSNCVKKTEDVCDIADLPCLQNLVLSGNPVSMVVDYRVKVLALFGKRAYRICLDNESTSQKELDKVAILKALQSSRQGISTGTLLNTS